MIYLVSNIQSMEGNLGLSDQIKTADIEEVFHYCSQLTYISVDTETDGVDWHKNKVIMVGNIFYRKEAKCIMRIKHEKINISGVSRGTVPSL